MSNWRVWAMALVALLLFGAGGVAHAKSVRLAPTSCHAVTPSDTEREPALTCGGKPSGYSNKLLWLRMPVLDAPRGETISLFVHHTRFRDLSVSFEYADGRRVDAGSVQRGNFGSSSRVGGQIAFEAPARAVPVRAVWMRIDQLAEYDLLRARVLNNDEAGHAISVLATLVGGALTLLVISAFYSASLAVGTRQVYLLWHSAWAFTVLAWGAIWSEVAAMWWPWLVGTVASQTCTALASLACLFATLCAMAPIEDQYLGRVWRRAIVGVGLFQALFGLWVSTLLDERLGMVAPWLALSTLFNLLVVFIATGVAWRRGSVAAREYLVTWTLPMLAVGLTSFVDLGSVLYGAGPQLIVLVACALQTAWLAISTTLRLAKLRVERDAARAAQQRLDELSRRDSLTGLLNRRGVIMAAEGIQKESGGLGLILIDLDHFKAINDRHGHDIGDAVLRGIGKLLRGFEGEGRVAGRMGGEEFLILLPRTEPGPLVQLAEHIRETVAAHAPEDACPVTVSVGVSCGGINQSFQSLYKTADLALYDAKRQGRNRVVVRAAITPVPPAPAQTVQVQNG